MDFQRLGLLGFVALVIAITGAWHLLIRQWAGHHRENPLAQAAFMAWG